MHLKHKHFSFQLQVDRVSVLPKIAVESVLEIQLTSKTTYNLSPRKIHTHWLYIML